MDARSTQGLWELVECADVAIRAASELRKLRSGNRSPNADVIARAIEFLTEARTGAAVVSGQATQMQGATLKPFNWATDAYLSTLHVNHPNYPEIQTYLDQMASALRSVVSAPSSMAGESLDAPIRFFEKLGDIVGSRADQGLRAEAEPALLDH